MSKDYDYYRKLVTSEYRHSPKYTQTVKAVINGGLDLDRAVDNMLRTFDLDNAGTNQLDIIGRIVGVARELNFSPSVLASGSIICPTPEELKNPPEEYLDIHTPAPNKFGGVEVLSGVSPKFMSYGNVIGDDAYRLLIKARIIQNCWKGTITELYSLWRAVFGESQVLSIQDLQDMSYNIVLRGEFSQLEKELITHEYIVPKPEGVRVNIITFLTNEGLPIFSYDYNTMIYSGYGSHWEEGEV